MNRILWVAALLLLAGTCAAQFPIPTFFSKNIPMRDGQSLAADLYSMDTSQARPVILVQTPYNKDEYHTQVNIPGAAGGLRLPYDSLNYHLVVVDWRGFYGSAGALVPGVPPKRGEDGYDCVQWIASQSWCNGKVGTWGPSALGLQQFSTMAENPPALVCAMPVISDIGGKYADYYANGVWREEHNATTQQLGFFSSDSLLKAHPSYDVYWQFYESLEPKPADVKVPLLMVTGWFDHRPQLILNDFAALRTGSSPAVRSQHKLLVGPWAHMTVDLATQGELVYPGALNTSNQLALRFFDYYLRNQPNGYDTLPVLQYYQMGSNTWQSAAGWDQVPGRSLQTLYLHPDASLQLAPAAPTDSLHLAADPRDPSPSLGGARFRPFDPLTKTGPVNIASVVESRPDALVFSTPPLAQDLVLNGSTRLLLNLSADVLDADLHLRLCDVLPDGRSLILTQDAVRLRYRNSLSSPSLLQPGESVAVELELHGLAQTFLAGHRLRIVLSGHNWPLFDRNPNSGQTLYQPGDTLVATLSFPLGQPGNPARLELQTLTPVVLSRPAGAGAFSFNLWPNPAQTQATLQWPQQGVQPQCLYLRNSLGQSLLHLPVPPGAHEMQLALPMLPPGIYALQLLDREGHLLGSRKLVLAP